MKKLNSQIIINDYKIIIDQQVENLKKLVTAINANQGIKIALIKKNFFFYNLFNKFKKQFYQKKIDFFFTESKFLKFVFNYQYQDEVMPGRLLYDLFEISRQKAYSILIIGVFLKQEKKLKNQFELYYGSANNLFFLSKELLYNEPIKVKQFLKKTNPKVVIINQGNFKKISLIISQLSNSIVFLDFDIERLYIKKEIKKSTTISWVKIIFFFPFYFFYFLYLKLKYNRG